MTWNNKPARGALIAEVQAISNGSFVHIDVTDMVKTQYDADRTISIKVESVPDNSTVATDTYADFSARENTVDAQRPRLVLTRGASKSSMRMGALESFDARPKNSEIAAIILYPNHLTTGQTLHLSGDVASQMVDFQLFNSSGVVMHRGTGSDEIQAWTKNAPAGIYLLRIKLKEGKVFQRRFSVVR